jgi:hypothetical protein
VPQADAIDVGLVVAAKGVIPGTVDQAEAHPTCAALRCAGNRCTTPSTVTP